MDGDLDLINNAFVWVLNGLTLNGTARLGNQTNGNTYGVLNFIGTQTLGGNGTVMFGPIVSVVPPLFTRRAL